MWHDRERPQAASKSVGKKKKKKKPYRAGDNMDIPKYLNCALSMMAWPRVVQSYEEECSVKQVADKVESQIERVWGIIRAWRRKYNDVQLEKWFLGNNDKDVDRGRNERWSIFSYRKKFPKVSLPYIISDVRTKPISTKFDVNWSSRTHLE